MEYSTIFGHKISRLTLGTVQFGLNYGVANKTGMPKENAVEEILLAALQSGINVFDTAYEYGRSEEILGNILPHLSGHFPFGEVNICTKLAHNIPVKDSILTSLKRLKIDSIPFYMLHKTEHMKSPELMHNLLKFRKNGLIKHIGVSIYTSDEAFEALELDYIEAIQIPFNVFDQKLRSNCFLKRAKEKGVALFARSVFLQGLIPMPSRDVPESLKDILPYKKTFDLLCKEIDRSPAEVAFKFSLAQEEINSVLFGVDNLEQLRQNLEIFDSKPLESKFIKKLQDAFKDLPENLINPSLWKKN